MPESVTGYQVDEHIRHRAVERLEGEPSQVARTSADATEGHLGHSLRREACDEAVAQVASAVDVDVAHRVVVGPRKDREEVEVLRGSLHRVVRVLQAAQLHLRLQETVFLLSDHSAVVASANSISITRFSCGGSIFPQRRMPTTVGRSSTSA